MKRGARTAELPAGLRQDTRRHTRHPLRPLAQDVERLLVDPADARRFARFKQAYLREVSSRFEQDRTPFDAIAAAATDGDVWLGCSCPTKKNPDVTHCHTFLALQFMAQQYPTLVVSLPDPASGQ